MNHDHYSHYVQVKKGSKGRGRKNLLVILESSQTFSDFREERGMGRVGFWSRGLDNKREDGSSQGPRIGTRVDHIPPLTTLSREKSLY